MQVHRTHLVALCAAVSLAACDTKNGEPGDEPSEAMLEAPDTDEASAEDEDDGAEPDPDPDSQDDSGESDGGAPDPGTRAAGVLEGECIALGVEATCAVDDTMGVQYCDPYHAEWGPCLLGVACELGDVQYSTCGFGEETALYCQLERGEPTWEQCGFTPLVLSFDGHEPTFDAGPDAFELSDGSNECLARHWPSAQTPWLAMDRDGSGSIENGSELFGSATPTLDGRRPEDGFDALADLDSNHDGMISAADEAWTSLLLWSDYDRSRSSSAWELLPIAYSGVTEIALTHHDSRRCDAHGNCGVERSAFAFSTPAGTTTSGTIIDVHIPCD